MYFYVALVFKPWYNFTYPQKKLIEINQARSGGWNIMQVAVNTPNVLEHVCVPSRASFGNTG